MNEAKKRYDGILLCCDYDHTLSCNMREGQPNEVTDPENYMISAIPTNNIVAIKEFVQMGGTFVVVSGRNPDEVARLREALPMQDLFVASNGTVVYSASKNEAVYSVTLDEDCKDVLRYLYKTQPDFDFFRITDNGFNFRYWRKGEDVERALASPLLPIYKIITESHNEDVSKQHVLSKRLCAVAAKRFGDRFKIEMSSPITVEICPKNSDKWNALCVLREMLEVERGARFERIVCVGDNQNDVEMIKHADVGIAVSNAIDSVKKIADVITVSDKEGAVADVIYNIL